MIGIDRYSARWKSSSSAASSATSALVPPNCSTRTSPCRSATAATASWIGAIRSTAVSGEPRMSKVTSADRPSGAVRGAPSSGLRMFVTSGVPSRVATRSVSAAVAAASSTSSSRCTSTISEAGSSQPLRSRISWACAGAPSSCSDRVSSAWGTRAPARTASATNASQPKTAVFRCRALHRPTRAARLRVPGMIEIPFERARSRRSDSGGAAARGRSRQLADRESGQPDHPSGGGRRPVEQPSDQGRTRDIGERPHPPRVLPPRAIRVLPVGAGTWRASAGRWMADPSCGRCARPIRIPCSAACGSPSSGGAPACSCVSRPCRRSPSAAASRGPRCRTPPESSPVATTPAARETCGSSTPPTRASGTRYA